MRPAGRGSEGSSDNAKRIVTMWAIALAWCAYAGYMFYVLAFQVGEIFDSAIAGIFLLTGLIVMFGAARTTLHYARRAPERDPAHPAVPGGAGVTPVIAMRDHRGERGKQQLARVAALVAAVLALAWLFERNRLPDSVPAGEERTVQPARPSRDADAEVRPEASSFEALPDRDIIARMRSAVSALVAGRNEEALQLYQEALAMAERGYGDASLLAVVAHYQISEVHQQQKNYVEQERALQRALGILERYSSAELKKAPEIGADGIDVALIAADLGYIYWEWRRYAEAYSYYERAHRAGQDSGATEFTRNRRLAVSAAGLMASACMLGKWDVADGAMAELKRRMSSVDDELKKWLDYWVRTGEPRLAARKC